MWAASPASIGASGAAIRISPGTYRQLRICPGLNLDEGDGYTMARAGFLQVGSSA
jgi:hypothetical protein